VDSVTESTDQLYSTQVHFQEISKKSINRIPNMLKEETIQKAEDVVKINRNRRPTVVS
jgi:hypothetical protein